MEEAILDFALVSKELLPFFEKMMKGDAALTHAHLSTADASTSGAISVARALQPQLLMRCVWWLSDAAEEGSPYGAAPPPHGGGNSSICCACCGPCCAVGGGGGGGGGGGAAHVGTLVLTHEHLLLFDERTELFSMPAADVSAASPVHEPPGRGWAWWATCGLCGGGAPTLDGKDFLVLEQWVPLSDVGAVEFECVTLGAPPPGLLVEVEHSAAVQLRAVVGFGGGRQLTLQFADDQGASLFQRAIRTSLFGPPEAPSGKWRSKASDATHATTNLRRTTE